MHTIMSPEATFQTKPPSCTTSITKIIAFFYLPNPRIFLLFVIGSTATTCLGIALIVEWSLCSQYHPGYHWIVYYAPSLITLPIVLWILCFIYAILSRNYSPLRVLPNEESRPQLDEQVDAFQDQLALVPIEPSHDHPPASASKSKHTSLSLVALPRNGVDDDSTLKRTFSLPLFHAFTNHSKMKRRPSF